MTRARRKGQDSMTAQATRSAAAASSPIVRREDAGRIAVLTLNRPIQRNVLSEAMLAALSESLTAIGDDREVHALVLAAEGPVFSAGHDLKEMTRHRADHDGGRSYFSQLMETCSTMMQQIVRLPQPVIVAVEGTATAAGCQLVASCDLVVASSAAKFGTSGINVGLFCSTPMVALSRKVGRKHAMEMLLTGELISADEAYRIGLVNRVVEPGHARAQALDFARRVAAKSPAAIRHGKQAFYRQIEMGIADAYRLASDVMVANMMEGEAEEGIEAFIEKRRPNWETR
jgi:enoyl-CoA hydratase/carnithine racemase